MNQAFYTIFDASECTKGSNLGHGTSHQLANCVALIHRSPGINLGAFDRKSDLLFIFIDAEYLDLDLLADV